MRSALITGGSSGIGLAIARVLGEEGHALTIVARGRQRLEAAAADLRGRGGEVLAVAADISDEDQVRGAVAEHRERFGGLDVLVNNAGIGGGGPIDELDTELLDRQLAVNLRSYLLFYRECVALLRASERALVVNLASLAGKRGQPGLPAYSATKHGVVGLTESMNRELVGEGIRSCALCPGLVDTPMTDHAKGEVPAERMIAPRDVAEAVRLLLRVSPWCVIPEIVFERAGA